jgi:hypothetical protein
MLNAQDKNKKCILEETTHVPILHETNTDISKTSKKTKINKIQIISINSDSTPLYCGYGR